MKYIMSWFERPQGSPMASVLVVPSTMGCPVWTQCIPMKNRMAVTGRVRSPGVANWMG